MEEAGIRLSLAGRREVAQGLEESERSLDDLGNAAEDAGNKAEKSGRKWERTRGILGGIGRGILTGVKITAGVGAAAAAIGIKTAAAMETAKIGFTTMLGSGKRARAFLGELSDFAAKTPFEFPDLQTAASSLVSVGIDTNKVIPIMTTLGDVTAGMGTGSEGIKRATNALQQMNAAGKISAEDLNQLRDAGIPVYDLLAGALGKTKAEVSKLRDEGKLGGDALTAMMKALETGKGLERFSGLMDKQSQSLTGKWSTLKDTVQMGLAGAIKPAIPLVKDMLDVASDLATRAMPMISSGLKTGVKWVRNFMREFKKGGGGKSGIMAAIGSLDRPGIPKTAGQIGDSVEKIGDAIEGVDWSQVQAGFGQGVADTISVTGVAVGFLADHLPELAKYLPLIIAGFVAWKTAQAAGNLIQIAAVPLVIAQTASNFALASANRSLATATGGAAAAQRGLNFAFLASPLGMVILAVGLLVGAFILAYKKSETFRGIVDTLFNDVLKPFGKFIGGVLLGYIKLLARTWLAMGRFGVMAFRWLLTAAFKAFDGILGAAEAGLGWVPGMGKKIRGAREAFDDFGDRTIDKLKRVEDRLRETSEKIDAIGNKPPQIIDITTRYTTIGSPSGPGTTRGRSDDFTPSGTPRQKPSGPGSNAPRVTTSVPRVPDSPADLEDLDPDLFRPKPGDPEDGPLGVIELSIDGDVVTRKVLKRVNNKVARQ